MSNNIVFADEKKGYNKEQVNRYIEDITRRYDAALAAKDTELAQVKKTLEDTRKQMSAISVEYCAMKEEKDKIAAVLIDSQVRADQIIAAAKREAEDEKCNLIKEADEKRDLLVARNKMLREMRIDICKLFDDMKHNIDDSYQNIIREIESDLEKFTEDVQRVSDTYPKENSTEVENVQVKGEEGSL
jgi:cell division septum initiation protein DivIVA